LQAIASIVPVERDAGAFSVDEVVKLTIEFYRRNYIEGLFLSSGVIRSRDATMSDMVQIGASAARGKLSRLYPP